MEAGGKRERRKRSVGERSGEEVRGEEEKRRREEERGEEEKRRREERRGEEKW